MPATEQIWRSPKTMHAIFGASAVVMLIATVWMFADDHAAEYKDWQKQAIGIDQWTASARIGEKETAQYQLDLIAKQAALSQARSAAIEEKLLTAFQESIRKDADRRQQAGDAVEDTDFAAIEALVEELNRLSGEADQAREKLGEAQTALHSLLEKQAVVSAEATEEAAQVNEQVTQANLALTDAKENLVAASSTAADARDEVLAAMAAMIKEAKRREDNHSTAAKAAKANFDAKLSERDIKVGTGDAEGEARLQAEVEALRTSVDSLVERREAAKDHRTTLDGIVRTITEKENVAQKELEAVEADLARLHDAQLTPGNKFGEWVMGLPIIDAFYTGDRKIDPGWLPELTININFRDVARFDRCATCHQAINRTAPGSAVKPAYEAEHRLTLAITKPDEAPEEVPVGEGETRPATLLEVYGIQMAPAGDGRVNPDDVTVLYTAPSSPGALAGLRMGDVIEEIAGARVRFPSDVDAYLLRNVDWESEEPIELKIRRGVPQPFASHPRLDLFVGSMSPHKKEEMGCTICHDGQGGATEFRWASHMPNHPAVADDWYRKHGWFDNPHWIFPMLPDRFIESGCLKCHHDVTELEPSERFPEPPAPKLVSGFNLVREYGCYGCHEINGYDGPDTRIGPDMRAEPNYASAAQAVLADEELTEDDEVRTLALRLVHHPDDDATRRRLVILLNKDEALASDRDEDTEARLSPATHAMASLLEDVETPGTQRKVGPSLRHVASKVDFDFLYDWIRDPRHFRPSTRMPVFFGQWEHLDIEKRAQQAAEGLLAETSLAANPALKDLAERVVADPANLNVRLELREQILADVSVESPNLSPQSHKLAEDLVDDAERFEPIEIRALTRYLLDKSQPFENLAPVAGAEPASEERGKLLFQTRGCLACHTHDEFPGIDQNQGPNLSRVGAKFNSEKGQQWLYSWIKEPNRYHVRTKMPNLYLDPITEQDGTVTDPAADIVAYLMTSNGWKPTNVPGTELSEREKTALADLAAEHLSGSFPARRAKEYLANGIPSRFADRLKDAEKLLLETADGTPVERQLDYVGVQTINKSGCFGCHDIPGFESAKPIGTALADWGRKETSKLAFEQIGQFLAGHGINGDGEGVHDDHGGGGGHGHGLDPFDEQYDEDQGYYLQALGGHHREGFIWQKLRMPRSYDYKKTKNKGYNERLRMPKFTFNYRDNQSGEQNKEADDLAREEIITFVLGLVNEPPAEQYIYKPDPRRKAIVDGLQVLDKYNCGGCHTLEMDRWEFAYRPTTDEQEGEFPPADPFTGFPFLKPHFSPEQIQESLKLDHRGLRHAVIHGQPVINNNGQPEVLDWEGDPIEPDSDAPIAYRRFTLYKDALIDGQPRLSGVETLPVPESSLTRYPSRGGHLARYLFPVVIAEELKVNPQAQGSEAWGWLPPPLAGEGDKVQTDWLHDFMLDPYPIRPAVVLRMPKFNMSSAEARKVANYFAAVDGSDYPYEFNPRRRDEYLVSAEDAHQGFLEDAMKIVVDNNYCVQCHVVGDFRPTGSTKVMGPDLSDVYRRLRPDWVRNWIANPKRLIPYTGMPQNIPYTDTPPHYGGVSQELFPGTSTEQVDGVVDLLMNFDHYARQRTSIRSMVKPPETPAPAAASGAAQ